MRNTLFSIVISLLLFGCAVSQAPYTGRNQLILVSPAQEIAMGLQASEDIKSKSQLITSGKQYRRVVSVGKNIAKIAEKPEYQWEFNLIKNDKTINAFVLPGGKVFFYTGILNVMDNDAQLASVMAHEIGHALARHGAERMTLSMLSDLAGQGIASAAGWNSKEFKLAYGMASNVGVLLPYSRRHESEADSIGLYLMAQAGYDPRESIRFWEKMEKLKSSSTPEFLSTHPSSHARIENLKAILPSAMSYYQGAINSN